jgi:hypothetical protein
MSMPRFLSAILAAMLAIATALPAVAARTFPEQARRGELEAHQYPAMKIGDRVYRLAAGGKIFNQQNLIVMPASLQAQKAPVIYLLDGAGQLSRVWLLTDEEAARFPLRK